MLTKISVKNLRKFGEIVGKLPQRYQHGFMQLYRSYQKLK